MSGPLASKRRSSVSHEWVCDPLRLGASPILAPPHAFAQELLHEDDRKLFANLEQEVKAGKQESKDYVKAFREYKQKTVPAAKAKAKAKIANAAQDSGARPSRVATKARPDTLPPPGHASWNNDASVQPLLPSSNHRIYYDRVNRRCQLFWVSQRRTRSFAWSLYGIEESACRCLKVAWDDHRGVTGESCPYPL